VLRIETERVWPKEDGSATSAYRLIDMYLSDDDEACEAVTHAAGRRVLPSAFELATGGARAVFAEVEES
jgi:hypothetical protein